LKDPIENLGLVIIDEQHRFGVNQRGKLIEAKNGVRPHFLSMTATPIPRTMSLVVFADLDVSVIDEMPKNRKQIITKIVSPDDRYKAYEFIRTQIKSGQQIFVICPLIDNPADSGGELRLFEEDKKTVINESVRLRTEVFPDLKVGMLHGKMKSKEKEEVMADFKAKKYDILVSTSVVEVGVDIPNATVMMIENAEAFGLAQLHQFRGRVGRSDLQSYCLLFSSTRIAGREATADGSSDSENAKKRLDYMKSISSGFKLAEMDLELRGPGQMYGYQQSGFWDFRFADIGDRIMIEKATEAAKDISIEVGKYPNLLNKVGETRQHLE
jgi:ATP-dependent DNA helicase RecG